MDAVTRQLKKTRPELFGLLERSVAQKVVAQERLAEVMYRDEVLAWRNRPKALKVDLKGFLERQQRALENRSKTIEARRKEQEEMFLKPKSNQKKVDFNGFLSRMKNAEEKKNNFLNNKREESRKLQESEIELCRSRSLHLNRSKTFQEQRKKMTAPSLSHSLLSKSTMQGEIDKSAE